MIDSPKDKREDFVINSQDDIQGEENLGREQYFRNHNSLFENKTKLAYITGGIGLVIVVILLAMVLGGPSDLADRKEFQALAGRIQDLEQKLADMGLMDQTLTRIDNNEKELSLIMERVDRFEGTVTTQIDQIIKELGTLHQKAGSAPAAKIKAPQPDAKSAPQKQAGVHEVRAGETLYSISRRYGLTVDQLRTYNGIGNETAIHPGQNLKLSPP